MRRFPAWGWSVIIIGLVLFGFGLGGGGPEGRVVSRALYPLIASLLLVFTLFAYMQQHLRPTHKLRFINIAAVVSVLYLSFPIWHFGVVLPDTPGGVVTMRWWVNGVVLALAVVFYFALTWITRGLRAGAMAVEDKPERLTV